MAGKHEIVDMVADDVEGLTKKEIAETFDAIFGAVTSCLVNDERVQVSEFGSFSVSHRKGRQGRNPQTGAAIHIPAHKVPSFRPSKALKAKLNS